ncbi:hypothetical protein Pcinc_014123 [Petrolisthes cinctipes]|uniref:Uncharacterized protein n=1 Tax=Petrolisthes cinctipes TaxID=88211 RepID=A0AAE1KS43_PETCI|nr:hypothetical protein Pcinc_014123 [Petrolisthes cinctipes]
MGGSRRMLGVVTSVQFGARTGLVQSAMGHRWTKMGLVLVLTTAWVLVLLVPLVSLLVPCLVMVVALCLLLVLCLVLVVALRPLLLWSHPMVVQMLLRMLALRGDLLPSNK